MKDQKLTITTVEKKKNIPDFISTLSTLPYLLKSRSISDCRASNSTLPQKMGLIFVVFQPSQRFL